MVSATGKGSGTVGKGPQSDLDKEKQAMEDLEDDAFEQYATTKLRDLAESSASSSQPNPEVQAFGEWVRSERARRKAAQDRLSSGAFMPGTRAEGDGEEEAEELKKEIADWEMSDDEGYAKGQRVSSGTMLDEDAEVGDEPLTNESKIGKEFFEATGVEIDWLNAADVNQKFQLLRRAITKHLKEIDATIEYFYYI